MTGAGFDRRAIPAAAHESKWLAADGHAIRRIDWPEPPAGVAKRGSLLFMAGRGDAYEKYLDTLEHWRLQGWRVSAADWRGQGGSGRLGTDDTTGHIGDFALWIADLAAFWSHWAQGREGPLVLVGHSMGGHLAMRAAIEKVLMPRPDALVLSAPMFDTFPEGLPLPLKRGLSRLMTKLGDPRRPAWKISERPGAGAGMRQTLLTHDDARYADEMWWREARPELKLGPGSWGWVASAAQSSSAMFRRGALEAVDLPVFIVATDRDRLVSPAAIRAALARLPDADALIFGQEARHEVLREIDPVRTRALSAIDGFLENRLSR
ncbi:alpha/beta fold hydrolase [Erythrobacter arachoides]|uniref:Alpha/beta fold hydrolase n=1 Tax=Aurantiacibacter arachoides TaxID=1850444 RepID=A0A844ZYW7_9SPHN|nr:alpha/beta hydrolase [Aurantiacibacter arachoides]MXO92430.1 alpha/beta fold hydrolase [Aurantiacibacter arachoides]GGD57222.1 lysophospholipase [Aurantiacibacter arachoides]